jgi:hypothetical protein
MTMTETPAAFFSENYEAARARFRAAAEADGARLASHAHPGRGPAGEALSTETALSGPADAERVLVTISATHGVEGFCGSGLQVGWYESGLARELPNGTAVLQIHAINPHGFAWLRRVTEENVDLNRNFVDHGAAYPENPGYEALHEALCPREWNDAVIAETRAALLAYGEEHGAVALQEAVTGGQYHHPDGIFYGGHAPTWSRETLLGIVRRELAGARRVAVIDYHTGLGPRGHGERITVHLPDSPGLARAQDWYGGDVTSPHLGNSVSAPLQGVNLTGIETALPGREVTAIALEYGTIPTEQVKLALRADNWLHVYGDPACAKGRAIKAQIREAFYQDADDWKEQVWARAVETLRRALAGLTQD